MDNRWRSCEYLRWATVLDTEVEQVSRVWEFVSAARLSGELHYWRHMVWCKDPVRALSHLESLWEDHDAPFLVYRWVGDTFGAFQELSVQRLHEKEIGLVTQAVRAMLIDAGLESALPSIAGEEQEQGGTAKRERRERNHHREHEKVGGPMG